MRANDAVNGAILILFAAIMIALTASFPAFPGQKYGPSLFPRLLGAGLIICGALLVRRGLQARRAGERWLTPDPWTADPGKRVSFALVLVAILFYILASEAVGFILCAFLILAALFLRFGTRIRFAKKYWIRIVVASATGSATIQRTPKRRNSAARMRKAQRMKPTASEARM